LIDWGLVKSDDSVFCKTFIFKMINLLKQRKTIPIFREILNPFLKGLSSFLLMIDHWQCFVICYDKNVTY